ncbi:MULTISPECIES: hypothetical protein [Pseudomonas]|nr:hypothetical protein [Pseudomonas aphyarum]
MRTTEWAGTQFPCVPGHEYERMLQGDVKYRFVIDNATLAG